MEWKKLVDVLKGHVVYLQTHNFPDPDALASAYGLQVFLKAHGVEASICYAGKIDKSSTRHMLDVFGIKAIHIDDIDNMAEDDYIVTVDAQKHNSNIADFTGSEVACIDHHPTTIPCEYRYSDIRICGACCSIVTDYFIQSETELDENTATALLYGLRMDTNSFNRGVTDFDIEIFAYLHKLADNQKIINMHNNTMEIEDLHAYGEAIRNIVIYENIGYAMIPFDCPDALIAMISDFILSLDVVEFSIIYAKRNGGYKFSVRNETEGYHAGKVTEEALRGLGGGGGHSCMAGGMITAENVPLLGVDPDYTIRQRFYEVIKAAGEASDNS